MMVSKSAGKIKRAGVLFNEFYGYVCEGIYQTQEEVNNSARTSTTVTVGDLKYRDISGPDGVPDGVISPEYDRVPLGNSLPRFQYGGSLNASYKGIDFQSCFFKASASKILTSLLLWYNLCVITMVTYQPFSRVNIESFQYY